MLEISKIPLLPALLENNIEERIRMENSTANIKNQSLLEWVTACQGLSNLEHIVEHCEHSLKQVLFTDMTFLNSMEYSCEFIIDIVTLNKDNLKANVSSRLGYGLWETHYVK